MTRSLAGGFVRREGFVDFSVAVAAGEGEVGSACAFALASGEAGADGGARGSTGVDGAALGAPKGAAAGPAGAGDRAPSCPPQAITASAAPATNAPPRRRGAQ